MKYFFFSLLLIFAINIQSVFSSEDALQKFLQSRLTPWQYGKNIQQQVSSSSIDMQETYSKDSQKTNISGVSNSLLQKSAISTKWFSINNFFLEWEFIVNSGFLIQPYIFVTNPNGSVLKFVLPSPKIYNNFILSDDRIFIKIPVFVEGEYQLELLDEKGFPVYNQKINQSISENSQESVTNFLQILENINLQREKLWYQKLVLDELLQQIAIRKNNDMQEKKYIWHDGPDGKNIFDFVLSSEKNNFLRLGENVSWWENISLQQSYDAILNSPAHRYLLLLPAWRKIGMDYREKDGIGYFVQVFSD